jgi:hypothetical protein
MLPLALLILLAGSACLACPPALPGVDQSPTAPGDYGKCIGEWGSLRSVALACVVAASAAAAVVSSRPWGMCMRPLNSSLPAELQQLQPCTAAHCLMAVPAAVLACLLQGRPCVV